MDEADLLGDECSIIEGPAISQEEEDALLGVSDVPTQAATIANPVVAIVPSDANENLQEVERKAKSEETVEKEELVELSEGISEKEGPSGLSATNSESSNDAPSPSFVPDLHTNHFFRSILRLQKKTMDKENSRLTELLNKQMTKMLKLGDAQRKQLTEMRNRQAMLTSKLDTLKNGFDPLATKYRMPIPQTLNRPPGSSVEHINPMREANDDLAIPSCSSTHQHDLKRKLTTPAVHCKRFSNGASAVNDTSRSQQDRVNQQKRLMSTEAKAGTSNWNMSSPLPTSPVSGELPPQRSLPRTIKRQSLTEAAEASRSTAVMPDPLPRPLPQQAQVATGIPRTHPAMKAPMGAHEHSRPRINQHMKDQKQQHPLQVTATRNGHLAPMAVSAGGVAGSSSGTPTYAQLSNMPAQQRKQALEHMNSQLPLDNQIGTNRALIMAAEKIRFLKQQQGTRLSNQERTLIDSIYKRTQTAERIASELDKFDAEPLRSMTFCERSMFTDFVVSPPNDVHKITVDHPFSSKVRPLQRPSRELPINAEIVDNDQFAPKIDLTTTLEGFNHTARLNGKIRFTALPNWPEKTARICIFYFIGTENPRSWTRSNFATVHLTRDNEQENYKEVSVKFVIQLDKLLYFENKELNKYEMIGIVACACAEGGTQIRGDEVVFDYESQEIRNKRSHIGQFNQTWESFRISYAQLSKKREEEESANAATDDDDDIQAL